MKSAFSRLLYRVLAMISRETTSSFRTETTENAQRGAKAFGRGCIVEAAYWMAKADLSGMPNLDAVLAEYVAAWVAKGCPKRDDSTQLKDYQQAFGLSVLLWYSNRGKAEARNWFEKAATEGDRDAAAFLRKHGA